MPTGYFETQPAQTDAPVEEINDFDLLMHEIGESSREEALVRMSDWIDRFQRGWTSGSDQWGMLVDLLPRPRDVEPSVGQFRKHLLSATREASASDYFLTNPAVVSKLSSYAWTDFLGSQAVGFVAGCLNLARAAAQSGSPSSMVMGTLTNAVANYHVTLIGIALHDPGLVVATEDGCSLADALDVPRERFERWTFDKSEQEIQGLVASFDSGRLLEVLRSMFGQRDIPAAALAPFVKTAVALGDEPNAAALVRSFAFEHPEISAALRDRFRTDGPERRPETLGLWACYLALPDAFAFGWECVKPGAGPESPPPFGETVDERIKRLEELLRIPRNPADRAQLNGAAPWRWRETALRAVAAMGTIVARKWKEREDQLVCEDEMVAALSANPELLASAIAGILDHGAEHWELLDPIILRLPADVAAPVLAAYVDRAPLGTNGRHHAARLLSRMKGEPVVAQSDGDLPPPAESLPHPSRQRSQLVAQTWLADGAIERLWHVALEIAQTRFDEAIATRYAEDKDDHCAFLADAMAKALNGTNSALKMWLRWNGAAPPSIQATARKLPSRKKGSSGLQADLGLLVRCKVAGKSVTQRLTLLRAKKMSPSGSSGGAGDFKLNGTERTQLARLLMRSPSTHYLFISPPAYGASLRVLPGPLVRDVAATQRIGGGVPAQMVFQAGLRLPEFMLFHVLGLWTGDDDKDQVAKADADADPDQAPHVVLDVTISKP